MIAIMIVGGLILFSVVRCIIRCACCGPCHAAAHSFTALNAAATAVAAATLPKAPDTSTSTILICRLIKATNLMRPCRQATTQQFPQSRLLEREHLLSMPSSMSLKKAGRNEDALPEMPSWETAGQKKVLVEEEAVELNNLKKPEGSGQNVPLDDGDCDSGTSEPQPAHEPRSPKPVP